MPADVLSDRALNRATLARQLLLERSTLAPAAAIGHLVGLQAQNPLDPYLALWSRLEGFDPTEVGRLLEERALVRIVVMRGTIHLLTTADALVLRPLTQPVRAIWRVELDRATKKAVAVVEHHPMPNRRLAALEAEGGRAIRFWQPAATDHDVRLLPVG